MHEHGPGGILIEESKTIGRVLKRRGLVTEKNYNALRDELDALSQRIETRAREFEQRGAFSGIHDAAMEDIRERSVSIKEKLNAAISKGDSWDTLKYELERDFHSLNEDFVLWEKRLDSAAMKGNEEAGSA
jgi:hypothetical protein